MKSKRSVAHLFSFRQIWPLSLFPSIFLLFVSCDSYRQFRYMTEEFEIPTRTLRANYNQAWLATLESLKRYDLELLDQESGVIKTRWVDNTAELNFSDSFGSNSIKSAKFKLIVKVIKGFQEGREVSRVTVCRRQIVERDFLRGPEIIPSDGILEKTVLYRIARELHIRKKIQNIEEAKAKEVEEAL